MRVEDGEVEDRLVFVHIFPCGLLGKFLCCAVPGAEIVVFDCVLCSDLVLISSLLKYGMRIGYELGSSQPRYKAFGLC